MDWSPFSTRRFLTQRSGSFARALLLLLAAIGVDGARVLAQSRVIGWGGYHFDSYWPTERYSAIDGGGNHLLLQRTDGTVIGQGWDSPGQCDGPLHPAVPTT